MDFKNTEDVLYIAGAVLVPAALVGVGLMNTARDEYRVQRRLYQRGEVPKPYFMKLLRQEAREVFGNIRQDTRETFRKMGNFFRKNSGKSLDSLN